MCLAGLGWLVCGAFLVAGVPLFLRMPPWCDLTLYEMAARAIMRGGTHYQDVFDTNFPGFVWCLVGVRRFFGTSVEAVRTVDLFLVTAITWLLIRIVRKCGASRVSIAWFAAAVAAFYPFTTEFSHCQRDVWMTLPILIAVALRLKHLASPERQRRDPFFEGIIWGVAVWFKPHVMFIAIPVWLITKSRCPSPRQDLCGQFLGGLLVGVAGLAWLIVTGTLLPFLEVFTTWNNGYLLAVWSETPAMAARFLTMFPPWSLLHLVGVPLAIRDLRRRHDNDEAFFQSVLATLYLAFLFQACALQRNFDYVHIPETLLLFAVLAAHRSWLLPIAVLISCFSHPALDRERMSHWQDCFKTLNDPYDYRQRQLDLAREREYFPCINPVEIGEVADWLRTQGVTDGEVIAWHDSPHAVYLELGLRTNFRFMHITTTLISVKNRQRMQRELLAKALPGAKYFVTDILHPMRFTDAVTWNRRREPGPDLLPPVFSKQARTAFPYNQSAVFRTSNGHGRYLVHRLDPDITERLNAGQVMFEFDVDLWP
ncbi:hypothetical protein BH11PLA2_BH11PLA2_25560 [soil metagenome]